MKKNILISALLAITCFAAEARAESPLLGSSYEPHIIVNNRILAKVNGKAISVIDVMKKMDVLFYRQFPQYSTSPQARYQFYQANWKSTLSENIDKELVLGDAEESKLVISAGDIRQEMETLFGPNIIENLDKIGLTFNEAYQMILEDITLRRMIYFRVQSKAISQVTPQKVRDYYDKFAKDNLRDNEWVYNVITIRHKNSTKGAEAANLAHHLLIEDKIAIPDLKAKFEEVSNSSIKKTSVSVSEEYHTKEKELSENYKITLLALTPNSYSLPIAQKSRSDNSTVFRIFYLKNMVSGGVIPYNEIDEKIKQKLLDEAINKETELYFIKLRQHFDVQDSQLDEIFASDFQPFVLK